MEPASYPRRRVVDPVNLTNRLLDPGSICRLKLSNLTDISNYILSVFSFLLSRAGATQKKSLVGSATLLGPWY